MTLFVIIFIIFSGSMYDWGNYWAKGINYRKSVREDIPYGGFFYSNWTAPDCVPHLVSKKNKLCICRRYTMIQIQA